MSDKDPFENFFATDCEHYIPPGEKTPRDCKLLKYLDCVRCKFYKPKQEEAPTKEDEN